MTSLYADLISDLEDARKASLLIEIQKKHIDQIIQEKSNFVLEHYCKNIYNKDLSATKTNVIFIDAKRGAQAQILATLYTQIGGRLKSEKSLESALKLGVFFATLGLSDLVDSSITDSVSDFLRESIDVIDGPASRWVGDKAEAEAIEAAEGNVDKILNAVSHRDNAELYLSKDAGKKLLEFATKLSRSHTAHEAMQFMVEFILSLGIGAPKLLVINDPFSLDAESLSLCSLLFSHAKDLKLQGEEAPISVVFNYTAQQPYEANVKNEKNAASLVRLRHMTQRYGMLEKPGSSIPRPAIKSTTFVGRDNELVQLKRDHNSLLEALAQDNSKLLNQWTLIKGEPGTGKTALINKYLSETAQYEDAQLTSQIRLRLLNQVGHSSEVTGLASLLQSIQSEANRLTLYYEAKTEFRWNEMGQGIGRIFLKKINAKIDSVKQVNTVREEVFAKKKLSFDQVKKAAKAIASLASHDTLYGSVEAAKDRYSLDKSELQTADAFNEGGSRNKKQEQFDKLISALRHLQQIAKAVSSDTDQLPIMLFIDDLQWIDELSAEFIITRLVGVYSIESLITARESDSQTSYKLAQAQSEHSPYKLNLFDVAKLGEGISHNPFKDTDYTPYKRIMTPIKVLGMDRSTVVNLINTVYDIDDKLNVGVITDALISALSEEQGEENAHVNTLFVVETLNLLSDPAFYRRFEDIKPLFVKNDKGAHTINVSSEVAFDKRVEQVFDLLKKAHKSAYSHDSMKDIEGHQFTLSSYAVMEERLFIIHQYFAECGDIATFTLQLSSLLSSPFSSDIVQSIIGKIIEDASLIELLPLKTYLTKQQGECLTPEHYELLEEVFEIIRRLPKVNNLYQYRHGLFSSFMSQKILHTLRYSLGLKDDPFAMKCFFHVCRESILDQLFYEEEKSETPIINKPSSSLNMHASMCKLMEVAYETDESWGLTYIESLQAFSRKLTEQERFPESIECEERVKDLLHLGMRFEFDDHADWLYEYVDTYMHLADSFYEIGLIEKARAEIKAAEAIIEPAYQKDNRRWQNIYVRILLDLGDYEEKLNDYCFASNSSKKALQILKDIYLNDKSKWAGTILIECLQSLSFYQSQSDNFDKSVDYKKQATAILVEIEDIIFDISRETSEKELHKTSKYYELNDDQEGYLTVWQILHERYSDKYCRDPEGSRKDYLNCVANLSLCLQKLGKMRESINYASKAVEITRDLFEKEPQNWQQSYCSNLKRLASRYVLDGRVSDGFTLTLQAISTNLSFYIENPSIWYSQEAGISSNFSLVYRDAISPTEKIHFYKLVSSIWQQTHENVYNCLHEYIESLRNLGDSYIDIGNLDEAISIFAMGAKSCLAEYNPVTGKGAESYCICLQSLADCYTENGQSTKAAELLQSLSSVKAVLKQLVL